MTSGGSGYRLLKTPHVNKKENPRKSDRGLQPKNNPSGTAPKGIEYPKLTDYNFTISRAQMVFVLRSHPSSRPPRPLQSDPSTRDQMIWWEFYGTLGHKTIDCRHLREEVANILAKGHLPEYLSKRAKNNYGRVRPDEEKGAPGAPPHVSNMIFGRFMIARTSFTASRKIKISITWEKITRDFLEEDLITFSDKKATGINLPHNDALVITVFIGCCRVRRVMVEQESSANILRWKVIEEMGLLEKIIPAARTLASFNMSSEPTKGEIDLPVEAGEVIKVTKFHDGDMLYKAIFGRVAP
ncbi:uncharacterized protein LOC132630312 [Lycium barbarum]|uniref:uncharacterized protein LOC132630312 n=1 Tax=Lycium barbarum TaxID=112863 RepID=UPI00293F4CE4|nr:uncharacterized protein LOC132630312 [Lycium barbarum]